MARHRLTALVLLAVAVTGCSRSDSVESTEPEPTPTVASTTTVADADTTTTTTTADATTTTVEATTTTAPATTTTVEATTTTTTTLEPPATVPGPAPTPPALAYVTDDVVLSEIDAATGDAVRTLVELFNGDGVFRGDLRLSPDGATIWFSEGYEDGWYSCESSVGSFGRVDVATGAVEIVGTGVGAEPSPDGTLVAYLSSDLCLPDPENPEDWVLTPYDRVVVRDLATGEEREFVTSPAPEDYTSPSQVEWAGFTPEGALLVRTTDAQLRLVDLNGSGALQDHPVVVEEVRGVPVGSTADALITIEYGDEGSADVHAVDPVTGASRLLATSEGFVTAGVAPNGAIVVTGFTDVSVEPGAPITVLTAPDGGTYRDIDW